jgi:hypothetical protein
MGVHHIRSTWQNFNNKNGRVGASCDSDAITVYAVDSQLCKTQEGAVGNRTFTLSHALPCRSTRELQQTTPSPTQKWNSEISFPFTFCPYTFLHLCHGCQLYWKLPKNPFQCRNWVTALNNRNVVTYWFLVGFRFPLAIALRNQSEKFRCNASHECCISGFK